MNVKAAWTALWNQRASAPVVAKSGDRTSVLEFFSMLGSDNSAPALETYARVATLYRAVTRIAFDLASAPLLIERKGGKEWKPLDEDSKEFGGVAGVFKRANPYEGRTALWSRFHIGAELTGSSYLLTDYENGGQPVKSRTTFPKSLRVLRADCVQPVFNDLGIPAMYRYTPSGAKAVELRPEEVLFHRYPSPVSEWVGVSPADAVRLYVAIEEELSRYQRNFFKNGARGSVVLSTDKTMTDEQIQQTRSSWSANNAGTSNAHSLWLAANGMKVTELQGRRDTDFVDLFRIIKEQVSTATGVPPAFLGDFSSATYANVTEQTPMYLEGCLYAKGALLEENLTEIVLTRFDDKGTLRARIDWNKVPMVKRVMLASAKSYHEITGNALLTREEARIALGYPEQPEVGEFAEPVQPQAFGNAIPPQRSARPRPTSPAPNRIAKFIDTPERNVKRVKASNDLDEKEAPAVREIRRYYRALEARVLARLPGMAKSVKALEDEMFDEVEEAEIFEGVLARVYTRVMRERGPEAAAEVGGNASDFLIDAPEVQAFIRENAYKNGRLITGTNAEKLRDLIRENAGSGETIAELSDAIRDAFDVMRSHAVTIARTETVRAYNKASLDGWKATEIIQEVAWLTAQDDAVRESHRELDGDRINIAQGERFSNGLQYPGDPAGDASETINCRCVLEPIAVDIETVQLSAVRIAPDVFADLFRGGTPSLNGTGAK